MITPVTSGEQYAAACSSLIAAALAGPDRPARWLGGSASALYLELAGGPVVAILASDAVRLPCGVLLPWPGTERPLTELAPPVPVAELTLGADAMAGWDARPGGDAFAGPGARAGGDAIAGGDRISWTGRSGPVTIRIVRRWAPARVASGRVAAGGADLLRELLASTWDSTGIEWRLAGSLARAVSGPAATGSAPAGAVRDLLGRGPGLTPAGDDLLAGYLLGGLAFGGGTGGADSAGAGELARLVRQLAPVRTTALSAQLLGYAADGHSVDQAAALASALTGAAEIPLATHRLLAIGHTSGAALAWGLLLAAIRTTAVLASLLRERQQASTAVPGVSQGQP